MRKGTKLYSMFGHKCPRCHEGDLFESSAFNIKNFQKMPEQCPNCQLRYESEPSFFYGAMYISYSMQVALIIAVFAASQMIGIENVWLIIGISSVLSLLLIPVTFRLSRSIYISMFVKYAPEKRTEYD